MVEGDHDLWISKAARGEAVEEEAEPAAAAPPAKRYRYLEAIQLTLLL